MGVKKGEVSGRGHGFSRAGALRDPSLSSIAPYPTNSKFHRDILSGFPIVDFRLKYGGLEGDQSAELLIDRVEKHGYLEEFYPVKDRPSTKAKVCRTV